MTTVTKGDLVAAVAAKLGLSKAVVDSVLGALVSQVRAETAAGSEVRIKGFGAFRLKERPTRLGRNPKTGAAIEVAASSRLEFRASKTAAAE